jgi:hypothetical protein
MRYESSVISISWIPSEAVTGSFRVAFDAGFTHYDAPRLGRSMISRHCGQQTGSVLPMS